MTPTREEIRQAYDSGYEAVVTLFEGTCKELEKRVMELERRLNQNSQNSHKPPSSDGLKRVPPRSQRKKTGRRSGGQVGHDGTRLEMVGADEVNEIVRHWPETCSGCGAWLEARGSNPEGDEGDEGQEGEGYTRRQVHDIPPIEIEVREHRAMEVRCGCCGAISVGSYPEEVEHEVQYGSGIKAWLTYASVYQLLPMERNTEMLADITGRRVSEGTLANALATCAKQVAPIEAKIKAAVIASEVIHVDETGIRMGQESHWLHVSSTPTLTHYDVDKQRGADAHERIGILPNFSGVAVHDRYKSFNKAPDSVLHSYCNAHILRDLTAIEELTHQSWPGKMKSVLLDMKAQVEQARTAGLTAVPDQQLAALEARYDALTRIALQSNKKAVKQPGKRGRARASPARNLAEALRDDKDRVIRFVRDFRVPFDNNQAERDLRMAKTKQKISGTFRSLEGARTFATLRGFISTARKQGHGALAAIRAAFDGRANQLNLAEQ